MVSSTIPAMKRARKRKLSLGMAHGEVSRLARAAGVSRQLMHQRLMVQQGRCNRCGGPGRPGRFYYRKCSRALGVTCECSMLADEPYFECPVHGTGHWPPRCCLCGRMLPWSIRQRIRDLPPAEVE